MNIKQKSTVVFFALLAAGIGLRLFGLNIHSLWYDEGCTLINSSYQSLSALWSNVITMQGGSERYQPLNILLLWGWRQMFGSSELVLRLFPALIGILSAPLIYWAAKNAFDRKAALWSLAVFTCSAFAVYYAQEVRPYALMLLLTTLQFGCFFYASRTGALRAAIVLGMASAMALFGSIFSALMTLSLALADLLATREFRRCVMRWLPSVLFCIPIILFYLSARDVAEGSAGAGVPPLQQPIWQNAAFSICGILAGTTFGPSIESLRSQSLNALKEAWGTLLALGICIAGLTVCFLGVIFKSLWQGRRSVPKPIWILSAAMVLMLGIQILFALVMNFNWQPRHTYWLCPVLAIVLGWLASRARVPSLFVLMLIGLNLYSLANYWFKTEYRKDDVRQAAVWLRQQNQPIVNISTRDLLPLYEYYGLEGVQQMKTSGAGLSGSLVAEKGSDLWLIHYRPFYSLWKTRSELAVALAPKYEVVDVALFKNINLYKVRRK